MRRRRSGWRRPAAPWATPASPDSRLAAASAGSAAGSGCRVDNLLAAEVVLANGRLVHASAAEHADLFWAIRGGGGNFGVITSFDYRLHPSGPIIVGGIVMHPFESGRRARVLSRAAAAGARRPDRRRGAADRAGRQQGLRDRRRLRRIGRGRPRGGEADQGIRPAGGRCARTAAVQSCQQSLLDNAMPPGLRNYWKADFISAVGDAVGSMTIGGFDRDSCGDRKNDVVRQAPAPKARSRTPARTTTWSGRRSASCAPTWRRVSRPRRDYARPISIGSSSTTQGQFGFIAYEIVAADAMKQARAADRSAQTRRRRAAAGYPDRGQEPVRHVRHADH